MKATTVKILKYRRLRGAGGPNDDLTNGLTQPARTQTFVDMDFQIQPGFYMYVPYLSIELCGNGGNLAGTLWMVPESDRNQVNLSAASNGIGGGGGAAATNALPHNFRGVDVFGHVESFPTIGAYTPFSIRRPIYVPYGYFLRAGIVAGATTATDQGSIMGCDFMYALLRDTCEAE